MAGVRQLPAVLALETRPPVPEAAKRSAKDDNETKTPTPNSKEDTVTPNSLKVKNIEEKNLTPKDNRSSVKPVEKKDSATDGWTVQRSRCGRRSSAVASTVVSPGQTAAASAATTKEKGSVR